jgi:hypothetical protein
MTKLSGWQAAKNPPSGYVDVHFTPREAKIVSMILQDMGHSDNLTAGITARIADYFKLDVERVEQIIVKCRRKIERARGLTATEAMKGEAGE